MNTTESVPEPQEQALVTLQPMGDSPGAAKDKAVSDLTAECYKRASQLTLTKEEIAALKADFPDEAFQPGAAGKENLIYIEHAALRERLDDVIGMGQWAMIPIRRWVEEFTYEKEKWINNRRSGQFETVKGSHCYVDAIMLIRGAFVASAIGEMTYYPDNHTQNYGDAVEGAETAALRRCCKRIGVGLQAWRKDWCLGWWERKRNGQRTPRAKVQPQPEYVQPATPADDAEGTDLGPVKPAETPERAKARLIVLNRLVAAPGQPQRDLVTAYCRLKGMIAPDAQLEEWDSFPDTPRKLKAFGQELVDFGIERQKQAEPMDLIP